MAARIIDFAFACLSHEPFLARSGLVIYLVAVLMATILAEDIVRMRRSGVRKRM